MADIHLLEGVLKEKIGSVKCGFYTIVYHLPINTPDSNLTFPDFVSSVPNISSTELDALKAGTLLEIIEPTNYLSTFAAPYYSQQLKDRWSYLNTAENFKYNFRVAYYLTELAH